MAWTVHVGIFIVLTLIGIVVGVTTVMFGFGGGFMTVPVVAVADHSLGGNAVRVATATSALVMLANAGTATLSTRREVIRPLVDDTRLLALLGVGGAVGAYVGRFAPAAMLQWGFVLYIAATIVDLLIRPGFLRAERPSSTAGEGRSRLGIATWAGAPIGSVAAFLGVGGSVMTVPMMRRSGAPMQTATTLANPLTFVISAPAVVITALIGGTVAAGGGIVGSIDVRAGLALLVGAMPVIVMLRRRTLHIPEAVHAWGYVLMLVAAGVTVVIAGR